MAIRLYVVGIHFRHHIDFVPDITDPKTGHKYQSGASLLAAAAKKWNLRYKLSTNPPSVIGGHINFVSYTPDPKQDNNQVDPGSAPRITFDAFNVPGSKVFPFFGLPLSLSEVLRPIGEISQVLQYTVQSSDPSKPNPPLFIPDKPNTMTPGTVEAISEKNDARTSFGGVGIPDHTEVRIRLLSIYCTY